VEIGIVGPPGSGKSTLFKALTGAEPERGKEKPNVGMAPVPDERLPPVAAVKSSAKITPAVIRVLDVAGTTAAQLGSLRRSDALLAVIDAFSGGTSSLGDLELELVIADRDHVERRLERVRKEAKSGDAARKAEEERLEAALAHLESGLPLRDFHGELPPQLEPLTTKPLVVVRNGPDGIDAKLEAELAELPEEEAAAYREGESALGEVVRRLFGELDLIQFFTAGPTEARSWTLRRGGTALDAAAQIHTDIARGFVRCEVIHWKDLVDAGTRAEVRRRGRERLEGKEYPVADGDVLNIRFTP
jgi:ribosome-binding ATPase YchF (GTP1/OBG family)